MNNKITWHDIYRDFKSHYPRLSKDVGDYRPRDILTISLYLKDGTIMFYNMLTRKVTVSDECWKKGE